MKQVWQQNERMSPKEILNILVEATTLLPLYCYTGGYDSFKIFSSTSSLMCGLDDQDDITANVAYAVAHGVCTEVVEGDDNLEDNVVFSIVQYLKLNSVRCK